MATSRSEDAVCRFVKDRTLKLETEAGREPDYNGVVVTDDTLLVIDNEKCNFQVYSHDGKLLYTSYGLEYSPMGVCLISKTEVAVCLWNSKILILSLKSVDDVKLVKTLDVRTGFDQCYSVAKWNSDKLVVSGRKWDDDDMMFYWCVVNLTDGRVDSTHKVCNGYIWSRTHLAIKHNTIYISCSTLGSITDGVYAYDIFNPHRHKFLYQHHGWEPWSVMADERNFIYVIDRNSNSIHQLTDSGQLVTIHTVSSRPDRIFYDDQHGVLYTTRRWSNVITVYRLEYLHQTGVPVEILNMDHRSIQLFEEALKDGKETVHSIRVMVVGHIGVGKTTLVKRLLGKEVNISERCSTEGIDVYVNCCDVSLSTCEWTTRGKDSEQDYQLQRLARVLNEQQSVKDKATDEELLIIPHQGEITLKSHEEVRVAVEDKNTEVPYHHSPQQDIDQELSSTASQQGESIPSLVQRKLTQSEKNTLAMLKLLHDNAYKLKQDTANTSPLTVWDFAGQFAFYTTHQTFLTRRAIYLLVSDVSEQLTDVVADECFFDSEGKMKCKVHDLLEVWLNLIHSCATSTEVGIPPVILVGTHVDQILQKQSSKERMQSDGQTTLFTTSTLAATAMKEVPRAPTFFGSVHKSLKPARKKQRVEGIPDRSMIGTYVLPVEDQSKKKRKYREGPVRKKMSAVNSVGDIIVDADADKGYRHEICERYFRSIRTYLSDKPTRFHLVDEDFAIDNSVVDSKLEDLKRKIVEVASKQPYWGEEIPARWLPLEQELMRMKAAGIKVIPRSIMDELNKACAVPIAAEELDLFVRFHHDIGTILYFSMEILREKIVLDPQWMIDALKSLITAEMFVLRSSPAVTDKWFEFKNKGKLSQELVDAVWTKEKHQDLHDNKEHILLLMEQLNIIAKLRIYSDEVSEIKEENCFLAPCMLSQQTPGEVICPVLNPQMESSSVICYVFLGKYLPFPIFHRLLAACVAQWPIATKKNEKILENLIFCGCCVFQLDHYHKLTIHFRDYIIYMRVTRMGIKDRTPSSKLCIQVREFVSATLIKIIGCLGQSLKFEYFIQCPEYNGDSINSLIPVSLLKENAEVCCEFHNNMIESYKLLQFWFEDTGSQGENAGNTANTGIQDQILPQVHDVRARTMTTPSKWYHSKGMPCSDPKLLCQILNKSKQASSSCKSTLEENCLSVGLELHGVTPANGNCFFEAVSSQLQRLNCVVQQSPQQLRHDVVAFMRTNRVLQAPEDTINLESFIYGETFEDYCTRMTRDGEWADHVVVVAMARKLQMDIMIVMSSPSAGPDDNIVWVVGQTAFHGNPILLGHIWESHYLSLQPIAPDNLVPVLVGSSASATTDVPTSAPTSGPTPDGAPGSMSSPAVGSVVTRTSIAQQMSTYGHKPSPTDVMQAPELGSTRCTTGDLKQAQTTGSTPSPISGSTTAEAMQTASTNSATTPVMQSPSSASTTTVVISAATPASTPSTTDGPMQVPSSVSAASQTYSSTTADVMQTATSSSITTDVMQAPAAISKPSLTTDPMSVPISSSIAVGLFQAQTSSSTPSTTVSPIPVPTSSSSTAVVMQAPTPISLPSTTACPIQTPTSISTPANVSQPPSVDDTDRFMHIACLLVNVGSRVLRRLLIHHTVTATCTLDQYLAMERIDIDNLRKRKILNKSQMDILFPQGGSTNLGDYDITLLSALFTNIVPTISQQQLNMIQFLRDKRNEIFAHAKSVTVNSNDYQTFWNDICRTLEALSKLCGDPDFENEILREIQGIQVSTVQGTSFLDTLQACPRRIETLERLVQALISSLSQESNKAPDDNDL